MLRPQHLFAFALVASAAGGCGEAPSATTPPDAAVSVDVAPAPDVLADATPDARVDVAIAPDVAVDRPSVTPDAVVDAAFDAPAPDVAVDAPAPDVAVDAPADVPRPPRTFRDSYALGARFPEGGIYDPGDHVFYYGSLDNGHVFRLDAMTGAETEYFHETATGRWWTLGMDVDTARRRLWVCAMDNRSPAPRAGYVWVIDLTTGARIATHALSTAAADATCTDVAVAADGRAYVCDREEGRIYRVGVSTPPTVFATDPLLRSSLVGQNALVVLPDQSALLTVIYGPPKLVHVNLTDGAAREVSITGRFSDLTPLAGADGMTFADGSAYVAFTSKLIRVTPTLGDWSRATSTNIDLPNGLTDVVSTPNGLYLLNGQSVRYALGTMPDPFTLVRFLGTL